MKNSKFLFVVIIFMGFCGIYAENVSRVDKSSDFQTTYNSSIFSIVQNIVYSPLTIAASGALGGYLLIKKAYSLFDQSDNQKKLQLFIYKDCLFCKKVTLFLEQHNLLDFVELIDANIQDNKAVLQRMSGRTQAPYLVDKDACMQMLESDDIIRYLREKFGISLQDTIISVNPVLIDGLAKYDAQTFLFDVQKSNKPVIVLVATTWCPPCKQFKPIFQMVADQMKDSCEFIMLDGDLNEDIVIQLKIRAYPTVVCFKNGQRINPKNYRTQEGLLRLVSELLQD